MPRVDPTRRRLVLMWVEADKWPPRSRSTGTACREAALLRRPFIGS